MRRRRRRRRGTERKIKGGKELEEREEAGRSAIERQRERE